MTLLRQEWSDATIGMVSEGRPRVSNMSFGRRANFWLEETERILAAHPGDASLAVAASAILDACVLHLTFAANFDDWPGATARCRNASRKYAARATELEPDNVNWWRHRAAIDAQFDLTPIKGEADSPPRLEPADFESHDPDNALYTYLRVRRLWETSTRIDYDPPGDEFTIIVTDPEGYAEGISQFNRAIEMPFLGVYDAEMIPVAKLLRRSKLSPFERIYALAGHGSVSRSILAGEVFMFQEDRALDAHWGNRPEEAWLLAEDLQRFVDQFEVSSVMYHSAHYRALASGTLAKIATESAPNPLTARELARLNADVVKWATERRMAAVAAGLMDKRRGYVRWLTSADGFARNGSNSHLVIAQIVRRLPSVILLLGVAAAVAALLSRYTTDGDGSLAIGCWGHAGLLGGVLAVMVTLLALAPAEIISREVQSWFFTIILLGAPLMLPVAIGWYCLHGRQYRFSIRLALTMTLVTAVLLALMSSIVGRDSLTLSELPFLVYVQDLDVEGGGFGYAASHWDEYRGLYWTVSLWAVLTVCLFNMKVRRRLLRNPDEKPSRRQEWSGLVHSYAKPCLLLATILLLVYLALTPTVIRNADKLHAGQFARAEESDQYWDRLDAEIDALRGIPSR